MLGPLARGLCSLGRSALRRPSATRLVGASSSANSSASTLGAQRAGSASRAAQHRRRRVQQLVDRRAGRRAGRSSRCWSRVRLLARELVERLLRPRRPRPRELLAQRADRRHHALRAQPVLELRRPRARRSSSACSAAFCALGEVRLRRPCRDRRCRTGRRRRARRSPARRRAAPRCRCTIIGRHRRAFATRLNSARGQHRLARAGRADHDVGLGEQRLELGPRLARSPSISSASASARSGERLVTTISLARRSRRGGAPRARSSCRRRRRARSCRRARRTRGARARPRPTRRSRRRARSRSRCARAWRRRTRARARATAPGPTCPAAPAIAYAALSWPRICASPTTSESSDDATRNTWRIAAGPRWS